MEETLVTRAGRVTQLDDIFQRVHIAYYQCKRAVGKFWGLSAKVVYWLHTEKYDRQFYKISKASIC